MEGISRSIAALNAPERKIAHRDLHQKNIMIHFKALEPTENDMHEPRKYMDELPERIAQ